MQTRKTVSKPGDGVGLARTGTMLYQIVFSAAVCFYIGNQLRDNIKLMKAGENQPLEFDLAGLFVCFGLQVEIFLQYFKQAVACQYVLPEIRRIVAVLVDGVTLSADVSAAVGTLIERQEVCRSPLKPGCHIDIAQVNGEMNENPLIEGKNRILAGSVELILIDSIRDILPRELTFELHRHHGNTV